MTNPQLSKLTDERIRAMAHAIWQTRQDSGEAGSADTDWQTAVNVLFSEIDNSITEKSVLTRWYCLGLPVLLGIVAFAVMTKIGLV